MKKILILAGGLGTRISKFTFNKPKCLVEIHSKPFLYYQLENLFNKGFRDFHFCLGRFSNQVEYFLRDYESKNNEIRITISKDGIKPLGTGGAIVASLKFLPETFFVTYGDSFLTLDFHSMEKHFEHTKSKNMMAIYRNKNNLDASNVILKKDGSIYYNKIIKEVNMEYIDLGCSIISKKIFHEYASAIESNIFDLSDFFLYLSETCKLNSFKSDERFYEIGSYKGIIDFEKYIASRM